MKIAIIGASRIGLVAGACLARAGNHVACVDIDRAKVWRLMRGQMSFQEPDLRELVQVTMRDGRLTFCSDLDLGTTKATIVFLTFDAALTTDASNTLTLLDCVRELSAVLRRDTIVAIKSRVPEGTCEQLQTLFDEYGKRHPRPYSIIVASNPHSFTEDHGVAGFRKPRHIVIGSANSRATHLLQQLYSPFKSDETTLLITDPRSAEALLLSEEIKQHDPSGDGSQPGAARHLF